jgi:hypothetical protein
MTIGNFTPEASSTLNSIISEVRNDYPLILDFKDVDNEMQGAFKELVLHITKCKRKIVLHNYNQLDEHINRYLTEFGGGIEQKKNDSFLLLNSDGDDNFLNDIDAEINLECQKEITKIVKNCFQEFPSKNFEYLSSTPILATGEYNASNIIANPRNFMILSLSLSDKLQEILALKTTGLNNVKVLAVSLRGSILASVVSIINDIPIDIVDHLGPKQMILEYDVIEKLKTNNSFEEYIYVGDFTIGGTEIKIAKTFSSIHDIHLADALVIGSFSEPEIFKAQFSLNQICSLKGLNDNAKYKLEF